MFLNLNSHTALWPISTSVQSLISITFYSAFKIKFLYLFHFPNFQKQFYTSHIVLQLRSTKFKPNIKSSYWKYRPTYTSYTAPNLNFNRNWKISFLFLCDNFFNLPIVSDVFLNVSIICLLKEPFRAPTSLHRALVQIEKHILLGSSRHSFWRGADALKERSRGTISPGRPSQGTGLCRLHFSLLLPSAPHPQTTQP